MPRIGIVKPRTDLDFLCSFSQRSIGYSAEREATESNRKVFDNNGEPIIGASVVVKGTSNGSITDIDGNYVITNVPVVLHW